MKNSPGTSKYQNVPEFLGKLWKMVNNKSTDHLIRWSSSGSSFIINNQLIKLLPFYYKHNNMSSFIRQLHLYGFRKIYTVEDGRIGKDETQFHHPFFQKDKPLLLTNIKRKANGSNVIANRGNEFRQSDNNNDVVKILADVQELYTHQETVDAQLSALRNANDELWQEIASINNKYLKQQNLITKIIRLLADLVKPSDRLEALNHKNRYTLMSNKSENNYTTRALSDFSGKLKVDQPSQEIRSYFNNPNVNCLTFGTESVQVLNQSSTTSNGQVTEKSSLRPEQVDLQSYLDVPKSIPNNSNSLEEKTGFEEPSYMKNKEPIMNVKDSNIFTAAENDNFYFTLESTIDGVDLEIENSRNEVEQFKNTQATMDDTDLFDLNTGGTCGNPVICSSAADHNEINLNSFDNFSYLENENLQFEYSLLNSAIWDSLI